MAVRLEKTVRKEQLIQAAMKLARVHGYTAITRKQIAQQAGVSEGLVTLHLSTMKKVTRAVMRHAVKEGDTVIIAQGLCAGDAIAKAAPEELRRKAAASLV